MVFMGTIPELSNRYRTTWEEFVRATNALQDSLAETAPDRVRAEVALFEAERARLVGADGRAADCSERSRSDRAARRKGPRHRGSVCDNILAFLERAAMFVA